MTSAIDTDCDEWLVETFAATGPFTVLFVLVAITERTVEPLRGAFLHIIGDETRWPELVRLFSSAGVDWSGVVFFRAGREGLVEEPEVKQRLAALTRKLYEDRSLIRDGDFFNRDGLRLSIEQAAVH